MAIPVYAQYSNSVSTPQYDPYDLDIPLDEKLSNETDKVKRDSIRRQAEDATEIKSLNFTNVRKTRTNNQKTPMPWNIENFSLTYAYTETNNHDPIVENDQLKTHNGIVTYDYSRPATFITPFKKLIKKDKYFKLITELNFNPLPNTYGFSSNMNRSFRQTTYRFVGDDPFFNTFYNKKFIWDRDYNLAWDITKALKFNFNALNRAIIDEPEEFHTQEEDPLYTQRRTRGEINDAIWKNIKNLGRTESYNHNFTVDYTLPLKKIPFLDWMVVKASYGAGYAWDAPYAFDPNVENTDSLGYLIRNNQTRRVNGDLSFEKLYNKSKYLKKINKKQRRNTKNRKSSKRSEDLKDGGKDSSGE